MSCVATASDQKRSVSPWSRARARSPRIRAGRGGVGRSGGVALMVVPLTVRGWSVGLLEEGECKMGASRPTGLESLMDFVRGGG